MRKNAKKCSKEEFDMVFEDEKFVFTHKGTNYSLCEGGENKAIDQTNYEEYI